MRPILAGLLLLLPPCLYAQKTSPWELEPSETTADLRGVHAVGGGVVWASGTNGTVLRSQDSGFEWQNCATPPGAEKLDFRAIWAWDDQTAIVMSSGPGALSRLYRTTDGCSHWTLVFTNPEPGGFYDALVFLDRQHGLVLGDATRSEPNVAPVEGGYYALRIRVTNDGGLTWVPVTAAMYPPTPGTYLYAYPGEGFFAASNSSAAVQAGTLWLATNQSRVLQIPLAQAAFQAVLCAGAMDPYSLSCGIPWVAWKAATVPFIKGSTRGPFSIYFRDATRGLTVGGDYAKPGKRTATAAWSADSGLHWTLSATPPGGYRSAVAWDADLKLWIAVGPNGSDVSRDDGRTWQPLEHAPADAPKGGEWNALSLPWAVGPHGRIGKLNPYALPPVGPATARPAQPKKPAPVPR